MLRRIEVFAVAVVLLVAALSTGAQFLFFLVYLGIIVIGGSYVVTRFGLADLEAGYVLDRLHAQAGDMLRANYTVRNASRLPKLWLEVHNPTTLPVGLPGQAISIGPRGERSWSVRVPLTRRGHFRVDPMALRTGDPLGLFESNAAVGGYSTVIVYPRVEQLPGWRMPPAFVEGSHADKVQTPHNTPSATSIREYAPGDAYNRIHWKTSARKGELVVKEFELEQTADVWIFLDLYEPTHTGTGDESTLEYGVRVAASIAARALVENRKVALTASGNHIAPIPADRGPRQYQKVMQALAAVMADGDRPLVEVMVENVAKLRKGMTAVIITAALDPHWVRPLGGLRQRGVESSIILLDAPAFDTFGSTADDEDGLSEQARNEERTRREENLRTLRNLRHALAEHDMRWLNVEPGEPLGTQLVTRGPRPTLLVAR
ncbi:MAG: hypothetical protein QOJ81_1962 [Chloroflexota bacterium]|jgi:uncharacterized protein (DUF58 family)|nr:hypothetical protein [Chloroflexota bacterium]